MRKNLFSGLPYIFSGSLVPESAAKNPFSARQMSFSGRSAVGGCCKIQKNDLHALKKKYRGKMAQNE